MRPLSCLSCLFTQSTRVKLPHPTSSLPKFPHVFLGEVSGLWSTKSEGVGLHIKVTFNTKFSKLPSFCGLFPRSHCTTYYTFFEKYIRYGIKLYFEFDCLDCFSPIFAPPTEKKSFLRLWITAKGKTDKIPPDIIPPDKIPLDKIPLGQNPPC